MTGVVYGEETAPRYEYDYNAKGQVARVRDNLLNRTTQSEYDLANRPVRVKTAEAGQHVYTGQVAYDNVYGNLSEFTEKVGENRQEFGTKFGYDDENRPALLTYSASGKEIGQSTTTIDKLNRTTFSAVKLGSKTFTSEYHFAAGGYGTGSVTNLVSSITQPGCNCGYGYDDNGNIASATLNGKWTGYTYDALGQLVQVNDHSDTRSGENGTTWKYTYDLGGNILKKERFAYADTTNPLETVTYTYGDANWRDKLTAVNGSTIRYDAIGNPLSDGTWTYTWQNGRQLQKMQKSGVTAEFVYNADGLRVQKTVNGVVTDYVLHGKNVVHMKRGNDELHFFYDAQNRPAMVVYNGAAYAYVKSLQGDIVAILDENGNMVVSYGYDAWGAPLWCTGELAKTLGKVQPFRYRGYLFDEETGLYYLRSRYYNPRWGRFVNADALMGHDLLGNNMYSYCANHVILTRDSDGLLFSWLQNAWNTTAETIREGLNWIGDKASAAWNWASVKISNVWGIMVDTVSSAWMRITDAATAAWEWCQKAAADAWQWTTTKAVEVWDWMTHTAADIWQNVRTKATEIWNWLKQKAIDIAGWFTRTMHTVGRALHDFITNKTVVGIVLIVGGIGGILSGVSGVVAIVEALGAAGTGVTATQVAGVIGELLGGLSGIFSGIGDIIEGSEQN